MSKAKPTNKILLCLPFWEGDKVLAMGLAHLIADIEPGHCALADFLFVSRFDTEHHLPSVRMVSRKFNTHTHTSKRRGTGWPLGCNDLFFGAMEFVYHRMQSGRIPNYKAIFVMGADGAPLHRDWVAHLHHHWDMANRTKKIYVAGALANGPDDRGHVNGDAAMLSGDLAFMKWLVLDVGGVKAAAGWDWVLAGEFHRWGLVGFSKIKSHWRRPTFTEADWAAEQADGTRWLHGFKGPELHSIARKELV